MELLKKLNEMGLKNRKTKCKPTIKQDCNGLEMKSWNVDDWMKVILNDESWICIGQGDVRIFVWSYAIEIYNDDCSVKTKIVSQSFMVWGCILSKIPKEINTKVYIKILDNFQIPSKENVFDNKEIIFQDDNASSHWMKRTKVFFKKNISIRWNSQQAV